MSEGMGVSILFVFLMVFILVSLKIDINSRERINKEREETKRQAINALRDKVTLQLSTADLTKLFGEK